MQQTFQILTKTHAVINFYKSYIRPILKHGNIVWGPQYITDQQNNYRESAEKSNQVDPF